MPAVAAIEPAALFPVSRSFLTLTCVRYDTVAKLLLHIHETRILSHGHVDGVEATWHRVDAIDATLKFRKLQKQTLSH